MGIRSRLGDLLLGPALERTIREELDRALSDRDARIAALEAQVLKAEADAAAARQEARTALATAESAAEGVKVLEDAALGVAKEPPKPAKKPRKKPNESAA
jgi:hypothetical protein